MWLSWEIGDGQSLGGGSAFEIPVSKVEHRAIRHGDFVARQPCPNGHKVRSGGRANANICRVPTGGANADLPNEQRGWRQRCGSVRCAATLAGELAPLKLKRGCAGSHNAAYLLRRGFSVVARRTRRGRWPRIRDVINVGRDLWHTFIGLLLLRAWD